jgi:hypothetical protein
MKTQTYPLAVPSELLREVRQVAKETGLSIADAMRQSMRLGLPKLREQLSASHLKPFTEEERRRCWEEPNREFDALEHHCASLPVPPPEPD